ncbi:MAG: hypothetical protein ABIV36_22550 [Sphingobium limneticum]
MSAPAKHTRGPWRQGTLLLTPMTRRWSDADREIMDNRERLMVFANFSPHDEGKSRLFIGQFHTPEDARLASAAPELLDAVNELLPSNLGSLHSDDFDEDLVIPVDMTVREIRNARAAIAKATGGAA